MQQTAQGFEARVSSLETDLDNISGGNNLIQNSQFKGGLQGWVVSNGWTFDEQKKLFDENTVKYTHANGYNPTLRSVLIPVEGTDVIGSKVTLSVYIFVPSDVTFSSRNNPELKICGHDSLTDNLNYSFNFLNITNDIERNKWVRLSLTATITPTIWNSNGTNNKVVKYISALLSYNAMSVTTPAGLSFWYGLPQLEFGSVPTNWTPSPKDISNRVESAETEISVVAGQLSSKVSTTDYTGNKIASLI
ncbi:MAG: hypothetical protein AB2401_04235, partial [Bacillus sp. (in: firmicutes)]